MASFQAFRAAAMFVDSNYNTASISGRNTLLLATGLSTKNNLRIGITTKSSYENVAALKVAVSTPLEERKWEAVTYDARTSE
jgi:hypothetical protein